MGGGAGWRRFGFAREGFHEDRSTSLVGSSRTGRLAGAGGRRWTFDRPLWCDNRLTSVVGSSRTGRLAGACGRRWTFDRPLWCDNRLTSVVGSSRTGGSLALVGVGGRSVVRFGATTDSRPWWARPASLRAGSFSLLAQRKGTKRNGTLGAAVTRASCARDCAGALRGFADSASMHCGKRGAIPRAAPAGLSCAPPPRPTGKWAKPRGHRGRASTSRPSGLDSIAGGMRWMFMPHIVAHGVGLLVMILTTTDADDSGLLPVQPWARRSALLLPMPISGGGQWPKRPAGGARWIALIAPSAHGRAVGATGRRPRTARAGCARGAAARAALLFGDFLLGKQEKVTGPQGCGTNPPGT